MTDIYVTRNISSEAAVRLVSHACAAAETAGQMIAAVVVDAQGHDLAARRMDGAAPTILDYARDKAFTAAMARRSSAAYFRRMTASPSLTTGLANRDRLLVWGGGVPVLDAEGRVIGAIGVSGATEAEDESYGANAILAGGFALPVES